MTRVDRAGYCTLCRSSCGAIYTVEGGALKDVRPDPSHPTGKAMCPKGRSAPEIAHSARRLRTPLRRTAPKGAADPGFVPITWDEALEEIVAKLRRIRAESGPEAVAFAITSRSSSTISDSNDWLQRLVRGFGSPNLVASTEICNWHKDYAHAFTFGCALPLPDFRNADLVMLWGHNPANVWLAQAEAIGAAKAHGAKLVVIDPRQAGSARDADLWLRVRPGTDGALALGLARWLIRNHAYDEEFVRQWTNAAFLVRDDNGRFLRAGDVGRPGDGFLAWGDITGEAIDTGAGLATASLSGRFRVDGPSGSFTCRPAFDLYREAVEPYDPSAVERLTGVPAREVEQLAEALAAAGSVCYHGWTGVGQHTNATQTERAIVTLYALMGHFDAPGGNVVWPGLPVPLLHSMEMIPPEARRRALGLGERPVGPPAHGMVTIGDFYKAATSGIPYRVRALLAFGTNPLVSYPEPALGRQALQSLDFQVHCDLFMNPTAEFADIVLPVSSAWEYEALRLGFEISHEAQEHVQLRQQMIPAQGEARSDLWIAFQIGKRLGLGDLFFDGDVEKGFEYLLAPLGIDLKTLREHPEGVKIPLAHRYRKYRDTGFATQSGKAELYSELLLRNGYSPLPTHVPPGDARTDQFPLTLFSTKSGYYRHSQDRGTSSLRRRRDNPTAEISPVLAARKGILEGDWMEIRTPKGAIRMRAALNAALAGDVVACDFGWWQAAPDLGLAGSLGHDGEPGSSFNDVVSVSASDPISGSIPLRSSACEIGLFESAGWSGWRDFEIAGREPHGEDVVSLQLRAADNLPLAKFRPGQYVTVEIAGETRSYSLTGCSRSRPESYAIAVKRVEGGRVSQEIHKARPGDIVRLQAPAGKFIIPLRNEFPIVLIAGGIGITPFIAYLETLSGAPGEPEVRLHYGCRDGAHQPFRDRLEALRERLPNFTLTTHLSKPAAGDRYDHAGRFDANRLDPGLLARRPRFYICASDGMLDETRAALTARGVPSFEIFHERFTSPQLSGLEGLKPRKIHFFRSNRTVDWSPAVTLSSVLATAEREGLVIPSGCRVGQCESCGLPPEKWSSLK